MNKMDYSFSEHPSNSSSPRSREGILSGPVVFAYTPQQLPPPPPPQNHHYNYNHHHYNQHYSSQHYNSHHKKKKSEDDCSSTGSFTTRSQTIRNGCLTVSLSYSVRILCGQILSFLLASSGAASSSLHIHCELDIPAFMTLGVFSLMTASFLIPLYRRGKLWQQLQEEGLLRGKHVQTPLYSFLQIFPIFAPVWAYSLMGIFNAAADYLNVLAFKYTTLTSCTVFGALSVPSSMVLSAIFLDRKYQSLHVLGALVCVAGVVIDVLSDYKSDEDKLAKQQQQMQEYLQQQQQLKDAADDIYSYYAFQDDDVEETFFEYDEEAYPHKFYGDILAILAGLCYGSIDVMAEYSARQFGGPMEFLSMTGVSGVLLTGAVAAATERDEIALLFDPDGHGTCSQKDMLWLVVVFVVSLFLHMAGVAYFVLFSESALLNMSLLTGNFFAIGFSILWEDVRPEPLFYAALALIVLGIVIYETAHSPVPDDEAPVIQQLPTTAAGAAALMENQNHHHHYVGGLESMTLASFDSLERPVPVIV